MPIKNKIVIIDGASKNVTEREMTEEELTELDSQQINPNEQIANAQAKQAERLAILDRLGISANELKTILG